MAKRRGLKQVTKSSNSFGEVRVFDDPVPSRRVLENHSATGRCGAAAVSGAAELGDTVDVAVISLRQFILWPRALRAGKTMKDGIDSAWGYLE
jgi:hypothetical protein